ncbi:MAG: glycosyl hydrolase [Kofleriaceae bacterium]
MVSPRSLLCLIALVGCDEPAPLVEDAAPVDAPFDVHVPPPRVLALDPSPFGLDTHLAGDDLIESFASIGIRWHRIDIDWDHVETAKGVFDWTDVDRVVAIAERLGLSVFGSISYTPGWASGGANRALPPRDRSDYTDFVREVVRRYRGRIACLGVWNEPNLTQFWAGTRTQYLEDILVPGLTVIRWEAPEMVTCGPDLSSAGNERANWLVPILDAAAPLLDVITHHQYDGGDTVAGRASEIELLRDTLAANGQAGKPIWITEIGWSRNDVTEAEQAMLLRGVMAAMKTRPFWTKTFWYDSHGADFGILGPDGSPDRGVPLEAYRAYADVIATW